MTTTDTILHDVAREDRSMIVFAAHRRTNMTGYRYSDALREERMNYQADPINYRRADAAARRIFRGLGY